MYKTPVKAIRIQISMCSGTAGKDGEMIKCVYEPNSEMNKNFNSNIKPENFLQSKPFESLRESSLSKLYKGDSTNQFKGEENQPAPKHFLNAKRNLFEVFESVKTPKKVYKKKNIFELSSRGTLASTEKKDSRKRLRKTRDQIEILTKFFNDSKGKWTRTDIRNLSKEVEIRETKVYKWLWDKRVKEEKKQKFVLTTFPHFESKEIKEVKEDQENKENNEVKICLIEAK